MNPNQAQIDSLYQQALGAQASLDQLYSSKGLTYDKATKTAKPIKPLKMESGIEFNDLTSGVSTPPPKQEFTEPTPPPITPAPETTETTPPAEQAMTKTSVMDEIKRLMGLKSDQGTVQEEIYAQEGVDAKLKKAKAIEAEYLLREKQYKEDEQRIRTRPGGFTSATNYALNELSRERNSELADIAIRQKMASDDYSGAYDIAERKVKNAFSAIDSDIQYQYALLDFIQNDLTESEKLQANAALEEQQAQRDFGMQIELYKEKAKIDAIYDAENSGVYSKAQLNAITKLNDTISKDPTYAKTVGMKAYVDTVTSALSNKNGVSDIAAINQFQKIIDEGAVTRDQDVKLISSAQSLLGTLQTKVKGLQKGDKLSDSQRQQMQSMVEQFYDNQVKALNSSPFIAAKTKEAALYGLSATDTILSEFGGFGGGGGSDDPLGLGIIPKKSVPNSNGGGISFGGGGLDPLQLLSLPGITFTK